jgi:hypothetical protein
MAIYMDDIEMNDYNCDMEIENFSSFMTVLPPEIHCHIMFFMDVKDLCAMQRTCRELNELVEQDEQLWKNQYVTRWLRNASEAFLERYYPKQFEWRNLYKTRVEIERKYLKNPEVPKASSDTESVVPLDDDHWKSYMKKGKILAKYETEDLNEFILLATIEEEQYKSATVSASNEKDKSVLGDIYYYWGRCVKDLSRDKTPEERYFYLLAEEEKYRTAATFAPNDSYVSYSWAINVRYQLEYCEGDKAIQKYKEAGKKYRQAMSQGYIEKYVLWGLGSLKLHMAKKMITEGRMEDAQKFIDKAEKKYNRLRDLRQQQDTLTAFSLCFNYACIYMCRKKIAEHCGRTEEATNMEVLCIDRLKECAKTPDWKDFLTVDLLGLWYFDDYRTVPWFVSIYASAKPKKLNACW